MFELTTREFNTLRSQNVTSKNERRGGTQYLPMVFAEQGVAMLSTVLRSKQAIQINIQIMRVFTGMRKLLSDNTEFRLNMAEIQNQVNKIASAQNGSNKNIELLFEYIDRLQEKIEAPTPTERTLIGYKIGGSKGD